MTEEYGVATGVPTRTKVQYLTSLLQHVVNKRQSQTYCNIDQIPSFTTLPDIIMPHGAVHRAAVAMPQLLVCFQAIRQDGT